MTFLADQFEKLANDPSWPWKWGLSNTRLINIDGEVLGRLDVNNRAGQFLVSSPLTVARLALMVVEKMEGPGIDVEFILNNEGINPDHYANIKKRVEEALRHPYT